MTNSRAKGARGEREWARFLSDNGFPAHRGQQFSGGAESPDVICPSLRHWFHPEVKRVERLAIYDAFDQAARDAAKDGAGQIPYVAHKKNNHRWLVILDAEDFLRLVREYVVSFEEPDDAV